ncbi:hypothetical protein EXW30_08785 [Bacillus mycoides]|nr:hypothetical protein EXW30_08785 [Bacillus mycoides]
MYSSFHPYFGFSAVIPHLRSVRLPPQNSAGAKKLGGSRAACKCPIGSTNNQRGKTKPPLIEVSLYYKQKE